MYYVVLAIFAALIVFNFHVLLYTAKKQFQNAFPSLKQFRSTPEVCLVGVSNGFWGTAVMQKLGGGRYHIFNSTESCALDHQLYNSVEINFLQ